MRRGLAGLVDRVAVPVVTAFGAGFGAGRRTRTRTVDDRAHIEVRGMRSPGAREAARRVERQVVRTPGVRSAEVNAVLDRVVVSYEPGRVGLAGLVRAVRDAERESGLADVPRSPDGGGHADDPDLVMRQAVALALNLAGFCYATAARIVPLPPLPESVPALLSMIDSTPRIRAAVAVVLGPRATDLLLTLGGAATSALAQRPLGLLVEAGHRFCLLREAKATLSGWTRWEAELAARPGSLRALPVVRRPRPVALPPGPVERVASGVTGAGLAAGAGVLAVTRTPQRAMALVVAGVPRAGRVGRDAFAAQLATGLADRDVVVLDSGVLRRLDRVDTVLIDAALLRTGARVLLDVIPIDHDADTAQLHARAHELVDLTDPAARRWRDEWSVAPVRPADLPPQERAQLPPEIPHGGTVLALARGSRTVGLVTVVDELTPYAQALITSAGTVGCVALADKDDRLGRRLGVDRVLPGGSKFTASVRILQKEGHGVVVVSAHGRAALAASDVGIGIAEGSAAPWGAHLVCRSGLAQACVLLESVPLARMASLRSAQMAAAGSASGSLFAMFGPVTGSQTRAGMPVSVATLLALGAGTWWGLVAARRPAPRPAPATPWHAMPSSMVLTALGSTPEGLSEDTAARRTREQPQQPADLPPGLFHATLEELANPLTPVLAAGAGVSATIGAMADAAMIGTVLGVNALIGGAQRMKAERALRALLDAGSILVRTRRAGRPRSMPAEALVTGDIVELATGDVISADCRLLVVDGLEVDESTLTGESQPVVKTTAVSPAATVADRHCMLYQGSTVAAGTGVAVVVSTGAGTELGGSAIAPDEQRSGGGVQARLRALTKVIMPVSFGAGGVLLIADMVRGKPFAQALGRAVSLSIAAVPEGLPFVATVAEMAAARRLSRRGALVRNPATIEALGRTDVLCFDKTGTLTAGRIALRHVSDGVACRPVEDLTERQRRVLSAALRASPRGNSGDHFPHPTDRAVVAGAWDMSVRPDDDLPGWRPVEELPFEPSRGYHAVLGRSSTGARLTVKGAPEIVLAACTRVRAGNGGENGWAPLDEDARRRVTGEVDRLARQGFRVLAVAERPAADRGDLAGPGLRDLDLVGLLALADPVRPTAAAAVRHLRQAGIRIVMVTGDHPSTAEAIATELDMLDGGSVLTGAELESLSDDELAARVEDFAVFARVSPTQKARIVAVLQRAGRVVAVTGDGANDAPAIRLADIGVALGEHATPAAREAADVIVTDDRIETIVDAIVEGRAMWASVRDALGMLLGGNLGEVGFTLGTGLLGGQATLNARQLLLVNLLTDALPAMAIAVRPPPQLTSEQLLAEGPEASLGSALTRDIYRRGAITAAAAAAAWLLGRISGTGRQASTVGLVALVGAQLGQTLAVRGRSPLVVACALASLAVLVAVVQLPGVSQFFGSSPLWPHGWAIGLGAAAVATAVAIVADAIRR